MGTSSPDDASSASEGRWYRTARFWKRFSVFISIAFSAATLILGAFASLQPESPGMLRRLTITSIVINSLSVTLSALTSLDWQKEATHDKKFAQQLCKVAHVHEGDGKVVLIAKNSEESFSSGM